MLTRLEDRVAKLEGEMDEVRHGLSDALGIRTELRAHIKSLEALRETQLEMGERMDRMGEKMDREFADVRTEIAGVRTEMRDGFTKLNLGMAQITALLNIAIGREGSPD